MFLFARFVSYSATGIMPPGRAGRYVTGMAATYAARMITLSRSHEGPSSPDSCSTPRNKAEPFYWSKKLAVRSVFTLIAALLPLAAAHIN